MPVPKRYFHCSQELNNDAELWEFTREFGDRALRTWLQILVFLDRSENRWRLSGDWLGTLSRMVRQSSANCSRQVAWLLAKQWLVSHESSPDGSPLILKSVNWSKYNRSREHKGSGITPDTGTQRERVPHPSYPTPTPILSDPTPKIKIKDNTLSPRKAREVGKVGFPQEWKPAQEEMDQWQKHGILNPWVEFATFRDHALANDRRCKDWPAAWRNWCRKAIRMKEERANGLYAMRK